MKNRRSTIIVAIMVALVGTPRAWQEFSNVLASLQHKTQNKLLSMAVNSQVLESGQEEATVAPSSAHLAPCPFTNSYQVADNRKTVNSPAPRKARAERRALPVSDGISTLAANAMSRKHKEAGLPPLPASSPDWNGENQLAMHAIAAVPTELMDKANVTEFVALPQVNVNPAVFVGKGADFIKLRKSFEESKVLRQKVRYIIARSVPALPST